MSPRNSADFNTWYDTAKAALGYTYQAWDPAGKAFMEAQSAMHFGVGMYPAFLRGERATAS
jgi:hypothetical protein